MATQEQIELRHKWLAALRSGEYKQGREALYNPGDNTYCCLGVLCKIAGTPMTEEGNGFIGKCEHKDGNRAFYSLPPFEVAESVGLKNRSGVYEGNGGFKELSSLGANLTYLNDFAGWDFNKIADFIESNPPGLFVD